MILGMSYTHVNVGYYNDSHFYIVRIWQRDVIIGKMPVMLRSRCCVLYGKDETELAKLGLSMHYLIAYYFIFSPSNSCNIDFFFFIR